MQEQENPKLVYFQARGRAQIIRLALLQIGIPFDDEFIKRTRDLAQQLNKKYGLQVTKLPYLVHENNIIYQTLPIFKYCCVKFNRPDLLGRTLQDSVRIMEIMVKYQSQKNRLTHTMMAGIHEIVSRNLGDNCIPTMRKKIFQVSKQNKFYQACISLFQQSGGYLLGYVTVVDYIFYQTAFNLMHLAQFENVRQSSMCKYRKFFENQQFYLKNREKINSYRVFFLEDFQSKLRQILQKLWREQEDGEVKMQQQ